MRRAGWYPGGATGRQHMAPPDSFDLVRPIDGIDQLVIVVRVPIVEGVPRAIEKGETDAGRLIEPIGVQRVTGFFAVE